MQKGQARGLGWGEVKHGNSFFREKSVRETLLHLVHVAHVAQIQVFLGAIAHFKSASSYIFDSETSQDAVPEGDSASHPGR